MPAGQFAFIIFVREPGLVSGQNNARLITLPTTALLLTAAPFPALAGGSSFIQC